MTLSHAFLILLCAMPLGLGAQTAAPAAAAPTKATFVAAGEKLFTKLEEFSTVLATANDAASAEVAKPKLAKINKEITALSQAATALGEPSAAIRAEMDADEKLTERAQSIMAKLVPLTQKVAADPAVLSVLRQTMRDFQHATSPAAPAPAQR